MPKKRGEKERERHYGRKQPRIQTEVLGHSLVRSLVPSHRSLVRLLRTARFARALRCAHSFARSLTSLTHSLVIKGIIRWLFCLCFFLFSTIVYWSIANTGPSLDKYHSHEHFASVGGY